MSVQMRADTSICPIENSTIILNERTGQYWQLNDTGSQILQALLSGADEKDVANGLATARPVSHEHALADIHALLNDLVRANLIECP